MKALSNDCTKSDVIGKRFVCDGHIGVVRFVGEVPPTEGVWLGVEWDDPSRGKHDGTCTQNGRRYFHARHPTSGSFLRPKKAYFGCSCLKAIRSRYCMNSQGDNLQEQNLEIIQRNNAVLSVEPVGYAKIGAMQSQLNRLKIVCLNDAQVSHAESIVGELRDAVPNIIELDLSRNLFATWNNVAEVCSQLSRLETLHVSDNMLQIPESPNSLRNSFNNVKVVVMNRMGYNWEQILTCAKMFPQLEELSVAFNAIDRLDMLADVDLDSIHSLDLEGNPIQSWEEVNKLGVLLRLKTLNLNATGLRTVTCLDDNGCSENFPSLESLLLQDNQFADWNNIRKLDRLPSLIELNIANNPLTERAPDVVRQMIIAGIGHLKLLNRTTITAAERRGAELDYLKRYGRDWLESVRNSSQSNFLKYHPRFKQLIAVHGAPEESESDLRPVSLKNNLISLQIQSQLMEEPIIRKLPGTLNVQKLRSLAERLTKITDPILHCESHKKPGHETEMDNDMRQLSFYAEDGDTIWIRASNR